MKRGQITVFIIVGILILTAVILTLYIQREVIKSFFEERLARLTKVPQEIQPIEEHIKFCIEDTAKLSMKIILLQGGYFEPKPNFEMESFDVAYWYDKEDISPSPNTIGKEIAKSMNYLLEGCIFDFEEDYEIDIKEISPSITMKKDKIIASADTNIKVTYKDITHDLKKTYTSSFKSEFKDLYDSAREIVKSEEVNPDNIDLTLLAETGYDVNFFRFDEVIVYTLSGDELTLMFANKF